MVELLVVIGVVALLISLLMPALRKARIAARLTQCMAGHRQLMQGFVMYVEENRGWGPPTTFQYTPPTGPVQNFRWYNEPLIGKYVGNRQKKSDDSPTTPIVFCPGYLYGRRSTPDYTNAAAADNIGIGYNVRQGARIARTDGAGLPQVKHSDIKRPAQVLVLVDTMFGHQWEKFYYNEAGFSSTGSNQNGMVFYHHGKATVASFADGHVEPFSGGEDAANSSSTIYGQNKGLHKAYNDSRVFFKYTGVK